MENSSEGLSMLTPQEDPQASPAARQSPQQGEEGLTPPATAPPVCAEGRLSAHPPSCARTAQGEARAQPRSVTVTPRFQLPSASPPRPPPVFPTALPLAQLNSTSVRLWVLLVTTYSNTGGSSRTLASSTTGEAPGEGLPAFPPCLPAPGVAQPLAASGRRPLRGAPVLVPSPHPAA